MQSQNEAPATTHTPEAPGTGTGAQASTPSPRPSAYAECHHYIRVSIRQLEAVVRRCRAEAQEHRLMAEAHRADPFLSPSERDLYAGHAEQRARRADEYGDLVQRRVDGMRREYPAAALSEPPAAEVRMHIQRDEIALSAQLRMGGAQHAVTQRWLREPGRPGWRSADPVWGLAEARLGLELAEYMEALDLPTRVADMLPRPAQNPGEGFARALEEVRRG